jgi:hypothetical protein
MSEWWIRKDLEGSGPSLILGIIPAFVGGTEENHENTSVRVASLRAEIWTRNLSNTK